jgi:hypothetical protein
VNTLEDRVRESLASYATIPQPHADLADTAIAGARAVRRRRSVGAAVAAAVVVAVVAGGAVLGLGDRHGRTTKPPVGSSPSATASPTASALRADMWRDNQLHTVDGRTFELTGAGRVTEVVRVPDGWLFSGTKGGARLLRTDGSAISLGIPANVAVSADGRSVAWADGATVSAARLSRDGVRDEVSTPVPDKTSVTTWIGRRVVLGQAYAPWCCGAQHMRHDVWDPAKGNFAPRWTPDITPVYGPVPDGRRGLGVVRAGKEYKPGCLAELDGVRDMSVTRKTCLPGLGWASLMGSLSPDGRHLAELRSTDKDDSLMVIDVASATVLRTCPASTPLVWEDNGHFLAADNDGKIVRCAVDSAEVTPIPGLTTDMFESPWLVPRHGI